LSLDPFSRNSFSWHLPQTKEGAEERVKRELLHNEKEYIFANREEEGAVNVIKMEIMRIEERAGVV
jgi:hypothetical protein